MTHPRCELGGSCVLGEGSSVKAGRAVTSHRRRLPRRPAREIRPRPITALERPYSSSMYVAEPCADQASVRSSLPGLCSCEKNFHNGAHMAATGVVSVVVLALRPESSAQARKPPTARFVPRGARRGSLVLTAGPVAYFSTGVTPPAGGLVASDERSGDLGPSPSARSLSRDGKASRR
jgi:hypothetical protein